MQTITATDVKKMKDEETNFLLINTLPADKFDSTKIEGAVNIPESRDDFTETVAQRAGSKTKPVVVYCANEACDSSVKAAEKLDQAGFEHVYEFPAGAKGWQEHCASGACK